MNKAINISVPQAVRFIIQRIEEHGFEAFAVGGCVRDSIRGVTPNDWDICTSALPEKVEEIFADLHVIETGLQHGTVTVMIDHVGYEITTYRTEGTYSDRRKPDYVEFVTDLREDVRRRDFTVNAMAYSESTGLRDFFGGVDDLERGIIRCVGDADERFNEDALRILRAMRFAAVFDFEIEESTAAAMHKNAHLLEYISKERIAAELLKLVCGKGAAKLLDEFRDIVALILPELEPCFDFEHRSKFHDSDVWRHTLRALDAIRPEPILRLTMLFHDCGKPKCCVEDADGFRHFYGHAEESVVLAKAALKRLKMSNEIINGVCVLVKYHDALPVVKRKGLMRLLNKTDFETVELLKEVVKADAAAHAPFVRDEALERLAAVSDLLEVIKEEGACFRISELAVGGKDLIAMGVRPGKHMGEILNALMNAVMDGEIANDKAALLERARELETN